jgi:class 3 adenylate cyclase
MLTGFREFLQDAEGRSEFIIAAMCDIRDFSQFSTIHESPDLAMFIKRFYLKLLDEYFADVAFAKPTGDGLLLVFRYSEKTLAEVSARVLSSCFKVLTEFPNLFKDDPMVNFPTPTNLGFGIARGTACCLYSGKRTLDYSGQVLNLAARLNDLARPKGVVVDGAYLHSVIPPDFRKRFGQQRAYIRSIAEDSPRDVLCSTEVTLPAYAQSPLSCHEWVITQGELTVAEIASLGGSYEFVLDCEILSPDKTKLQFGWPNQRLADYTTWKDYRSYECHKDAKGNHLRINLDQAKSIIAEQQLKPATRVIFEFQYVPKLSTKK